MYSLWLRRYNFELLLLTWDSPAELLVHQGSGTKIAGKSVACMFLKFTHDFKYVEMFSTC